MCVCLLFLFAFGWKATHRWWETQKKACRLIALVYWCIAICACACMYHIEKKAPDEQQAWHTKPVSIRQRKYNGRGACVTMKRHKTYKHKGKKKKKQQQCTYCVHVPKWKLRRRKFRPTANMKHKTWEHMKGKKKNTMAEFVCVCVCVSQVCTDEGEGAGECINLPQISAVVLGISQPSSHLNNMMPSSLRCCSEAFPSSSSLARTSDLSGTFVPSSTSFPPQWWDGREMEMELRPSTHSVQ